MHSSGCHRTTSGTGSREVAVERGSAVRASLAHCRRHRWTPRIACATRSTWSLRGARRLECGPNSRLRRGSGYLRRRDSRRLAHLLRSVARRCTQPRASQCKRRRRMRRSRGRSKQLTIRRQHRTTRDSPRTHRPPKGSTAEATRILQGTSRLRRMAARRSEGATTIIPRRRMPTPDRQLWPPRSRLRPPLPSTRRLIRRPTAGMAVAITIPPKHTALP